MVYFPLSLCLEILFLPNLCFFQMAFLFSLLLIFFLFSFFDNLFLFGSLLFSW